MDIKELAEQETRASIKEEVTKETDKKMEEAVQKALEDNIERFYAIPEGDKCLTDINEIHELIKGFIKDEFKKGGNPDERARSLANCEEAIKILNLYKTARINVKLSEKIKFEIASTK